MTGGPRPSARASAGCVVLTLPSRGPVLIWERDQAMALALELCEALHRAWPDSPSTVEGS